MKTIGLLGGMSWESTLPYYRIINEGVRSRLGGLHSARIILYSVDFDQIEKLQHAGDWGTAADVLVSSARAIERGGAEFLILCTNTMHKVADQIQAGIRIPLLHIADATAAAIRQGKLRKVGLLGTKFTMEEDFYRHRLETSGLEVVVPPSAERDEVHRVIYEELCRGEIKVSSRLAYQGIIERLVDAGAEGVILGCTEISLLIGPENSPVPVFDTTAIHANAAADYALGIP